MRKLFCRLTAFVCVMLLAAGTIGCGGKEAAREETTADMQALRESMLAADTTLPEMKVATSDDDQAELNFTTFSDFSYERVQSYFYAYAADGGTQEVAVVQLKDTADAAALMNSMQAHLEDRKGALTAYAPDQLSLVDHAVIKQKGSLVAMIISEKSGLIQQAFEAK